MFFDFVIYPKFKGGTLIEYLISSLSNLAESLYSKRKSKNRQAAKIWSL
jgi:predicted site-specific integrase-resolvase